MNAIQLLKNDHLTVKALLTELARTTKRAGQRRSDLLAKIGQELRWHCDIEEKIFYPALKRAAKTSDDDKMYFEALEEHRAAGDLVLPDLESTDVASDKFGGRAKVLKELIEHHADEEEEKMFPRAQKLLGAARLQQLGAAMAERKRELQESPVEAAKSTAEKIIGAVATLIAPISSLPDGDGAIPKPARRRRAPTAKSLSGNRKTTRTPARKSSATKASKKATSKRKTARQLTNGQSRAGSRSASVRP
jgi:hemerythrin superfamily protein